MLSSMKYFFIIPLILLSASIFSQTDSLNLIINKYIDAIGGKDNLDNINTVYIKRKLIYEENNTSRLNYSYQKKPNYRIFGNLTAPRFTTTDGTYSWKAEFDSTDNVYKWSKLSEKYSNALIINGSFYWFLGVFVMEPNDKMNLEYAGKKVINGIKTNIIKVKWFDGSNWEYYLDAKTNLIYQLKPNETTTVKFLNYKEEENILFAHKTIDEGEGQNGPYKHRNIILEIEFNIPLKEELFTPPNYKALRIPVL